MDFNRIKYLNFTYKIIEESNDLKNEFDNLDKFLAYVNSCSNITFSSIVVTIYKNTYLPSICLKDNITVDNYYYFHIFTDDIESDIAKGKEIMRINYYENLSKLNSEFEYLLEKNKRCLIIDSII